MHQRDLGGKHAIAADEALGSVDRIHQPDEFGIPALRAALLTEKPMLREVSEQHALDDLLGLAVGHSDRGLVGLQFDAEFAAVVAKDFLRGRGRGRQG